MAKQGQRSSIIMDWVNVTYRTAGMWAGVAVLVLIALGWYWYHSTQIAPRNRAAAAVQEATVLLVEARSLISSEAKVQELRANSRSILDESNAAFDAADWGRALQTAIHSANLSEIVIDMVKGKEKNPSQVQFLYVEGDVKVKRAGEFSWEPVTRESTLNVGDQVKTTSSGSAQLLYFDGTLSTIHAGSLLEIRQLYENPATKERRVSERLGWGSMQVSTQNQNVPGSAHEVSTEVASASEVVHVRGPGQCGNYTALGGCERRPRLPADHFRELSPLRTSVRRCDRRHVHHGGRARGKILLLESIRGHGRWRLRQGQCGAAFQGYRAVGQG